MSEGTFMFDGHPVPFRDGQTVGAALWASGVRSWRSTRVGDHPRGLFCGIGACFDCLAVVEGRPDRRLCLEPARSGLLVVSQSGAGRADQIA
jgi:2Fe-2S iron-sulfur cluster binding domain